jgi:beta-glucosidase
VNKRLKRSLIAVGVLFLALVIAAFTAWRYVDTALFSFEDQYAENVDLPEILVDGRRFLDRNRNGELDDYEDDRLPVDRRVDNLLSLMTLDEKLHLLKGAGIASAVGRSTSPTAVPGAAGTIVPTPRLGIPTIYLSDGPAGLRIAPNRDGDSRTYYATAFPVATLLASTWNQALVAEVGRAMGSEAREYGVDVILGPGANIMRHPLTGRNFEYFSEDPVLTGHIGAAIVNGIESNGVGASVKHFVANNQETDRTKNNVIIAERPLREIYLKAFELIVRNAQPWTIMSSYNRVNGTYTSESRWLLSDVLRDEWGFEGIVMTDWFAGRDAVAQINAGNDLLEPGTKRQWTRLIAGAESGELSMDAVDRSVRRILRLILGSLKIEGFVRSDEPDLEAHAAVTRQAAAEGMILLKNDNTLPLREVGNVALLGVTSYDFIAGGTGSGDVNEAYSVSLEEGLANAAFDISESARSAYVSHRAENAEAFIRPEGLNAIFEPYEPPEMSVTRATLERTAADADLAIITIGRNSGEGGDRREDGDFRLKPAERALLTDTADVFHAAEKKVVVVLNIGGVIETASWRDIPDAILLAWQGGQEGGNAVADVLRGDVNPSGRLPMTFPLDVADHASHANFPSDGEPAKVTDFLIPAIFGPPEDDDRQAPVANRDFTRYEEGLYIGYRHFDKAGLDVAYPFGFGLSYTDFEFGNLQTVVRDDALVATLDVVNAGGIGGKEVVQFYVSMPASTIDRPVRELEAFGKTPDLEPGESAEVSVTIPLAELRYWDEGRGSWTLEAGRYRLEAGASSRDIRLVGDFEVTAGTVAREE